MIIVIGLAYLWYLVRVFVIFVHHGRVYSFIVLVIVYKMII